MSKRMKILVLGATGMLGHSMFRVMSENKIWDVYGLVRSVRNKKLFDIACQNKILAIDSIFNHRSLRDLISTLKPTVVINCIGIIKSVAEEGEILTTIHTNSVLPHLLANFCGSIRARLIHISTDCVYSGTTGMYSENDKPDPVDLYGRTKLLGEVNYSNAITLRTSIIGHELVRKTGLLEWFLSQNLRCRGYTRAIFSGFPTFVFSEIVRDLVIPDPNLHGLFHVGSHPISKYDLLSMISSVYKVDTAIEPDDSVVVDRSLCQSKFHAATGYVAPNWLELINSMRLDYDRSYRYVR